LNQLGFVYDDEDIHKPRQPALLTIDVGERIDRRAYLWVGGGPVGWIRIDEDRVKVVKGDVEERHGRVHRISSG